MKKLASIGLILLAVSQSIYAQDSSGKGYLDEVYQKYAYNDAHLTLGIFSEEPFIETEKSIFVLKKVSGTQVTKVLDEVESLLNKKDLSGYAMLGKAYEDSRHYDEAVKLYRKLAVLGDTESQSRLGSIHMDVNQWKGADISEGLKWLRLAAKKNDSNAQLGLATYYRNAGKPNLAFEYTLRSAMSGGKMAQANLGYEYAAGTTVTQSYAHSYLWYLIYMDNGGSMFLDGDAMYKSKNKLTKSQQLHVEKVKVRCMRSNYTNCEL